MIKAVLDTNVLVSATFWSGASKKIIEKAISGNIKIFTSEEILKEYEKVLASNEIQAKMKEKNLEIGFSILKIRNISNIINVKSKVDLVKEDPDTIK